MMALGEADGDLRTAGESLSAFFRGEESRDADVGALMLARFLIQHRRG